MYLCTDTANFATLLLNFTKNAVEQNCRNAKSLANLALMFFSSREVADLFDKSNPAECVEGVTIRPRATIVPAIPFDANMPDAVEIKKRIYYGRMMDFFIADFFDALACGYYLWQCKYCGRYFLMTSAHRQLYCQTPPPGAKYPCYKLAKNRRTATEETKANKQAAADNFLHYYEGILNSHAERFIETYAISSSYFADLKLTFVSILWEEFLKYDPVNPIPLLQIIKPKVNHAWHKMVAKQIGALTVNEKVYANWRKISAITKKYRE